MDNAIGVSGQSDESIGANNNTGYLSGVFLERQETPPRSHIPEPDCLVFAPRQCDEAVWAQAQGSHPARVASEGTWRPSGTPVSGRGESRCHGSLVWSLCGSVL